MPNNDQKPLSLVPAPAPAPPQPDAERHKRLVSAIQVQFACFPRESLAWVLEQTDTDLELTEARFIVQERSSTPHLKVAPAPAPPTPEQAVSNLFVEAMASALESKVEKGTKVTFTRIDFEAERQAAIRRGGADIELDVRAVEKGSRRPRRAVLGIKLVEPGNTGDGMAFELMGTMSWQLDAFRRLAKADGLSDKEALEELLVFTTPLYVWPGTGLLDPEESDPHPPRVSINPAQLLGLKKTETEEEAREHVAFNQRRLERRQQKHQRRVAAANARERLFGDAMITPEVLNGLVGPIDVEHDRVSGLTTAHDAVRLWELPFEKLLETLPPEAVGLALFGGPAGDAAERLRRCAWKLRGLVADKRRDCLVPLRAFGAVFLPLDAVDSALGPLGR